MMMRLERERDNSMSTTLVPPWIDDADDESADGLPIEFPPEPHTLEAFRSWVLSDAVPEKLRVSYLNGRITVDMSKEEILTHAEVKAEIGIVMGSLIRTLDFGKVYINGVLLTDIEADVSNNPDMVAISWPSLESDKVRFVSAKKGEHAMEIEGSPDWVLEIVSRSSVTKDTRDLRHAYHQAGIREYWLVDARGSEIDFRILHWRKAGYVSAPSSDGWLRSRVFPFAFQLSRTRDRRGGWNYKLASKPV